MWWSPVASSDHQDARVLVVVEAPRYAPADGLDDGSADARPDWIWSTPKLVDFQAGSVAMARGRTQEARSCYDRALTVARASHLRDAGAVMIGEVLAAELEFERSAGAPRGARAAGVAAAAR